MNAFTLSILSYNNLASFSPSDSSFTTSRSFYFFLLGLILWVIYLSNIANFKSSCCCNSELYFIILLNFSWTSGSNSSISSKSPNSGSLLTFYFITAKFAFGSKSSPYFLCLKAAYNFINLFCKFWRTNLRALILYLVWPLATFLISSTKFSLIISYIYLDGFFFSLGPSSNFFLAFLVGDCTPNLGIPILSLITSNSAPS